MTRHNLAEKVPKDLAVLLASFLLLATIYAWAIPYFQSSDELGHFEYVKRLTLEGHLPELTRFEYFATEQHQPPGYYFLASLVGRALMALPLVGPAGQMALVFYGARGVSIAFGLATVAGVYLLARHFFGPRRLLTVGAAAIVAFNPGIIAIMGAVTNDSMATAVGAFVLLATVKAASASRWSPGRLLLIGAVAGLAGLTKENLLYLLLPLAMALMLLARRSGSPGYQLMALLAVVVPAIAIGGWWYLRNWTLYGDPLAWKAIALLSPGVIREEEATLAGYASTLESVAETYWIGFGETSGVRASLPVYLAIWAGCGAALFGLYRLFRSKMLPAWLPARWKLGLALLAAGVGLALLADLSFDKAFIGAGAGRYFYPVAGAIAVLLALGLYCTARTKIPWLLLGFCTMLAALSAITPPVFLLPLRVNPPVVSEARLKAEARPLDATFGGSMQLVGYRIHSAVIKPGDRVQLSLYWKASGRTTSIWTNYVRLVDRTGAVFGRHDSIPLRDKYPALFWKEGEVWREDIELPVAAVAPDGHYQLKIGMYRLQKIEDASVNVRGRQWEGGVYLGDLMLVSPGAPLEGPSPVEADFQESIRLTGWSYENSQVVLYWQPSEVITRPLTSFVHFLDADYRMVAQHDGWPGRGRMPTFVWQPGENVRDEHEIKASPGTYILEVGFYDSDTLEPVRLLTGEHSLVLGQVQVP